MIPKTSLASIHEAGNTRKHSGPLLVGGVVFTLTLLDIFTALPLTSLYELRTLYPRQRRTFSEYRLKAKQMECGRATHFHLRAIALVWLCY